jgi:hypothetical protein
MMLLDHRAETAFRAACRAAEYPGTVTLVRPYGLWLPISIAAALAVSLVVAVVLIVRSVVRLLRAVARRGLWLRFAVVVGLTVVLLVDGLLLLMTSNIIVYYPGDMASSSVLARCIKP